MSQESGVWSFYCKFSGIQALHVDCPLLKLMDNVIYRDFPLSNHTVGQYCSFICSCRAVLRSLLVFKLQIGLLRSPAVPTPNRKKAQVCHHCEFTSTVVYFPIGNGSDSLWCCDWLTSRQYTLLPRGKMVSPWHGRPLGQGRSSGLCIPVSE